MTAFIGPTFLAPTGSTGNNTHTSIGISALCSKIAVAFVVEAVGTTVTWKAQGSISPTSIADGTAAWFDLPYVLPSTDTLSQAAFVRTTVGTDLVWLAAPTVRFFQKLRLVTSANTGITYRAELYGVYGA